MKNSIILCALIILFQNGSARSADWEYYDKAVKIAGERLLPILIDRLDSKDRAKLKNLKIVKHDDQRGVIAAYTNRDTQEIFLGTGLMFGLHQYVDCQLISKSHEAPELCNRYFRYFFDEVLTGVAPPKDVAVFFFGNSSENLKRWNENSKMNDVRRLYYTSAINSILMHEIGHHVVGFAKEGATLEEHIRQERKVDDWAFQTFKSIGEAPIFGAIMSLGYFSQVEAYRKYVFSKNPAEAALKQLPSNHASPRRRAEWAFAYNCKNVLDEKQQKMCDFFNEEIKKLN